MEIQGGLWSRLFYTLGGGIENNAVFGVAGTPRASLAYYLVRPGSSGIFSGTRLTFNFAKGIKEPSIYYQNNSLYTLLSNTALVPNGPQLISQYHIQPFLAENSRTYDGGIQQQLFDGKASLAITYFHNEFTNQAEFVDSQYLTQLGVPEQVAEAQGIFGAAVNTLDYRAQGAEVAFQYQINRKLMVRGGWTYTDAVVQQSFASSALTPAINPLFPNILIGAYSPLVGARPFRIAPNTGFAGVTWSSHRWFVSAMGTFVSRRDDSTFLTDTEFRQHPAAAQSQSRLCLPEGRFVRQLSDEEVPQPLQLAVEHFEPALSGSVRISGASVHHPLGNQAHFRRRVVEAQLKTPVQAECGGAEHCLLHSRD